MARKYYTVIRTSLGNLYITAEHGCITRIGTEKPHLCAAVRKDTMPILQHSAQALMRYLGGERTAFPYDLHLLPFQRDVFAAVRRIPYGQCITSRELAVSIGKPHAVRAVESVCRNNPLFIAVPCHRVMLSDITAPEASRPLLTDEALRRLEKRYLDKDRKRR